MRPLRGSSCVPLASFGVRFCEELWYARKVMARCGPVRLSKVYQEEAELRRGDEYDAWGPNTAETSGDVDACAVQ